jgi:hypothetical protein
VLETVASIQVPAGSYSLAFKALVGNRAAVGAQSECYLYEAIGPTPPQVIDATAAPLFANSFSPGSWQTLTLLATRTTPAPTTYFVQCANSAGDGFVQYAWLIGTKVGQLN